MGPNTPKLASLLPAARLMVTESRDQFEDMHRALYGTIKPAEIMEEILTRDITNLTWEIFRLWRLKTAIVNKCFVSAAETIFTEIFQREQDSFEAIERAEEIAHQWFTNPEKGLKILRRLNLDESAIEAEAYSEVAPQIESLDRLLALAESRRNKALRALAEYRSGLAKQSEEASKRIIDGEALAIDDTPDASSEGDD